MIRHESTEVLPDCELYRRIVETIAEGLWVINPEGHTTFVNGQMLEMLGYTADEMQGEPLLQFIDEEDQAIAAVILERCSQGINEQHHFQFKFRRRDGSNFWATMSASPIFSEAREYAGTLCRVTTKVEQAEEALRKQAQREQALNRVTQAIRRSLDLDTIFSTAVCEIGKLQEAGYVQIIKYLPKRQLWLNVAEYRQNPDWPTTLGVKIPDEGNQIAAQLKQFKIVCIDDASNSASEINRDFAQIFPGTWLLVPLHFRSLVWGSLSLIKIGQADNWHSADIEMLCKVADELSVGIHQAELYQQLEEANQNLQRLAYVDGLTQVVNRRRFDECLYQEWRRLAREKAPLSLIMCDVDFFKLYNDTYGHQAGDKCLQQIAHAISCTVKRSADLVARYGGEEFAVILPNTQAEGAVGLAEEIRARIKNLSIIHKNSQVSKYVTLSLGVASTIPEPKSSPARLVAAADRALYQAKAQGRDRVILQTNFAVPSRTRRLGFGKEIQNFQSNLSNRMC